MAPRTRLTLLVLSALVTLFASLPAYAQSQFQEIWLTAGPDGSSMVVSWTAPAVQNNAIVEYGLTMNYGNTAIPDARDMMGGDVGAVHHAVLPDLQPEKVYHYRIVDGSNMTGDFSFQTAPTSPCGSFSFAVFGDNRSQGTGSATRFDEVVFDAMSLGARFAFNTGDLVKDGSELNQWKSYLSEITGAGRVMPVMPTTGNHDDGPGGGNSQNITRLFHTPSNNTEAVRSYYSIRYGNAIFAVINNHDGSAETQAAWLDDLLANTDAIWKFVFVHEPFFTCTLFGHEPDESGVGHLYLPIFQRHHVDFVFTGHNHLFELFKPHNGSNFVDDPAQGTIHVVAGGAAKGELVMLNPAGFICDGRTAVASRYHFVMMHIDGEKLWMEYWDEGGAPGGTLTGPTPYVAITKPPIEDCLPPTDGDVSDGDVSDGDVTDGDVTDGDVTDGDVTDGDVTDGDVTDGDVTDGDVTDGDTTDGDTTDGDTTDGDTTDGDATDGDATDGDATDGDQIDGDMPSDGDAGDGDATDGDITDGDIPDGDIVADGDGGTTPPSAEPDTSGSGCSQSGGSASIMLLSLAWLMFRRRSRLS